MTSTSNRSTSGKPKRNRISALVMPVWIAFNVFVAALTIFSGLSPNIDQEYMPFAGLVSLTFPAWYLLSAVLVIVNLLISRYNAIVPALGLLITLKQFIIFCPLNFSHPKLSEAEAGRSFKIMSYNVLNFLDAEGRSTPDFHRTLHTIIHSGADALAILEYQNINRPGFLPKAQVDSINAIYPYFKKGSRGTVLFSKRPILHIVPPENMRSKGSIEVFRTNMAGKPVNIFAVHLESIGLNNGDKELYRSLTDADKMENANKQTVSQVRTQLISKLYTAFSQRAWQAKMLRSFADQLGGDIVICGDFNDTPGCRAVKILEEVGFKDAYAQTETGPRITFNDPYFRFRIDHVLWRGNFKAISVKRGNVASSDHYPMLSTFVWDEPAQRGTND